MGRRVDPAEVAAAAVWLASDEANYVTAERLELHWRNGIAMNAQSEAISSATQEIRLKETAAPCVGMCSRWRKSSARATSARVSVSRTCWRCCISREMRYDPKNPSWQDRDRFILSTGHYAIGLYAALAEAGIIPLHEIGTYGTDGSRLEMAAPETTPGVEITGGSLGHGCLNRGHGYPG